MDVRPANFLVQQGQIMAIIDWSNALIGDPALEIARIAEYGFVQPEFVRGYGQRNCFEGVPPQVEVLYRLDTAVMLSIVFLTAAPDPLQAEKQRGRVVELCEQAASMLHQR